MTGDLIDELPELSRMALANGGANRGMWLAAFALDARIGRMVIGASEPMLGQMRLAWWRDQLSKPESERPRGDPLLDLIGRSWADAESSLIALVNGWEALLAPRPLTGESMGEFVKGRTSLAEALANRVAIQVTGSEAQRAGSLWALADLAAQAQDGSELNWALDRGTGISRERLRLPRSLRPLAVIGGLARRSLRKGGIAMVGDRMSPFVAIRLGLVGR